MFKQEIEIGGEFHLSPSHLWANNKDQHESFKPVSSTSLLTSSGRASMRIINQIINLGPTDEVLLPAYMFEALLSPFKERGAQLKFYRLNEDLSLDVDDIKKKINIKTKLLFIIHYFGFPQPMECLKEISEAHPSCVVVEDLAQAFLSMRLDKRIGRFGDFSLNVYRKLVPVVDGSILFINKPIQMNWGKMKYKHVDFTLCRYLAMNLKYIYLSTRIIPKSWHLKLFYRSD
ncbi:MAG: aminotransferase class V-fold PLP-dependent enzyme, partial [Eubacteriales bacterium]